MFDQVERSGEIYMIAVDPAHQRLGIANELTEHALDEMRTRHLDLAIVATGGDPGHPRSAAHDQDTAAAYSERAPRSWPSWKSSTSGSPPSAR